MFMAFTPVPDPGVFRNSEYCAPLLLPSRLRTRYHHAPFHWSRREKKNTHNNTIFAQSLSYNAAYYGHRIRDKLPKQTYKVIRVEKFTGHLLTVATDTT